MKFKSFIPFYKIILICKILLLSSCSKNLTLFNQNKLFQHVKYLASDKLEGRFPGTNGDALAAQYIKNEYKKNNLKLLDEDGFQYFDFIAGIELGENNILKFKNYNYFVNEDFVPLSFGKNTQIEKEIIFAGYGLIIDEDTLQWNDYKKIDASNKWVMILRGSPDGNNPHSNFYKHTSLRKKAIDAKDNNAAGVIFVSGKEFDAEDNLINLNYEQSQQDIGIPVIHIKRNVADEIFKSKNLTIEGLEKTINTNLNKFNSFEVEEKLNVQTDIKIIKKSTQNVIGLIEGNDEELKNEYIVIGAHYDHIGYGGKGSGSRRPYLNQIHNGADDNASGVSILIELSNYFSKHKNNRSIIFIAFGAEELGLIGSKHFVNSNIIPLEKIQIMINMDMVGRLNDEQIINVSGTNTAIGLENQLADIIINFGIKSTFSSNGYGPSDHSNFYINDVPVLFFFTGGHNDYHTPNDDYQKLNYKGMKIIQNLLASTVNYFDISKKLEFQESGPKEPRKTARFKVTLGIMPDYVFNEVKGLRIDAVIPNKPADKAGLQNGDIIIKMSNKPVNDIYEYMHRLSECKSGDTIEVMILRKNQEIIYKVTL